MVLRAEIRVARVVKMLAVCAGSLAFLAACAAECPPAGQIWDPYETQNRETHEMNKALVAAVSGDAAGGEPGPLGKAVSNVGHNLGLPRMVVNSVLQGRPEPALKNTLRFAVNSTIGVAGLFDPAGHWFNLTEEETDFGETLHVWGVREGAYMELPLIGPSTERDTVGRIVDVAIDPVGHLLRGNDRVASVVLRFGAKIVDSQRYAATTNSILFDSTDSYTQSRLLYLQNRRHQLANQEELDAESFDPYEDPYLDPYAQ